MKIAVIGSRGIPAKYGGFETFTEGLTQKLAEKKHEITVTCEYEEPESRIHKYNNVKLEYFPLKPPRKYFLRKIYETISDIYFLIKLSSSYDLIYFLGIEAGIFLFIPKLLKRTGKLLVNIDGVMWKRNKFNRLEKWLLKLNHICATIFADIIIADAKEMKNYVSDKFQDKTVYLPYGIDVRPRIAWNGENIEKLGNYTKKEIIPNKYFLVVARMEPENNIHTIVDSFSKADVKSTLVMVGDFTSPSYQDRIYEMAENSNSNEIIFLGSIYDDELLYMLRQNCIAYIHGHSVGGTNPSLLESGICKNLVLANDNQFNHEVCGKYAFYFNDSHELKEQIELVGKNPDNYSNLKNKVYDRVKKEYSWDKISKDYDWLLKKIHRSITEGRSLSQDSDVAIELNK
jgi:rhamnosyltransferase